MQFSRKLIPLEEFVRNEELWKIFLNSVVVYPTDTVYGIGCDAENVELVERIYEIKRRDRSKPLSIIAPSFEWIEEHFVITRDILEKFLPGKYTLVLEKKNPSFLSHVSKGRSVGVRIIEHEIMRVFSSLKKPIVTTSANLSGKPAPSSIEEIDKEILSKVDYIIDGGKLYGKPSRVVEIKVLRW